MLLVNQITFSYNSNKPILENINFQINQGEVVCVMGESGSGKSTLLKTIYGLTDLDKGNITWKNSKILGPEHNLVPGFKKFKYVPQDFELMPFISVSENIGKYLSRFHPVESQKRIDELLSVIEMTNFANQKVKNLSGGQQQRVAIARALANEPEVLLLDEPFGQIDNFKKNSLRRKLFAYLKKHDITCIIATHDVSDALSFADKLIILKNNTLVANNTPSYIYDNPQEKYIASLFDDVNEIQNKLLYPHQLKITDNGTFNARVTQNYFKGNHWLIKCIYEKKNIFISHHINLSRHKKISFSIK